MKLAGCVAFAHYYVIPISIFKSMHHEKNNRNVHSFVQETYV